jgi:hypothetical protein
MLKVGWFTGGCLEGMIHLRPPRLAQDREPWLVGLALPVLPLLS